MLGGPHNNALQLTRARSAQQVRAERHFVPHRAFIIYGPSQLNAVFACPQQGAGATCAHLHSRSRLWSVEQH